MLFHNLFYTFAIHHPLPQRVQLSRLRMRVLGRGLILVVLRCLLFYMQLMFRQSKLSVL